MALPECNCAPTTICDLEKSCVSIVSEKDENVVCTFIGDRNKEVVYGKKKCCCAKRDQDECKCGEVCVRKILKMDDLKKFSCPGERKNIFDVQSKSMRFRCKPPVIRDPKIKKFCLGCPIGVSFGSFNLNYLEPKPEEKNLLEYAICLAGFAEIFVTPEEEWNILVINRILDSGKKLIELSIVNEIELNEVNVVRRFIHCKNALEIKIWEPSFVGKIVSHDFNIPNLRESLARFFTVESYALIWIEHLYYLVWKAVDMYFIFDAYGRCTKTCRTNRDDGLASLIAVTETDNVFHLLANLSLIKPINMFSIRRIQLIKFEPCCENLASIEDHIRKLEWEVVTALHAVLNGHLNIGAECFKDFRFKQALAVAVIALVYAKADPSCTWDSHIIEQIIIIGTRFYRKWTRSDYCYDLIIQDIPGQLELGQYIIEFLVTPFYENGEWQCVPTYRHSNLTKSIENAFLGSKSLIIQIERKSYAMWYQNGYFYLFDPYEHQKSLSRGCVLHMCSTIKMLCCIFTQTCLEIPNSRPYYIHIMKVYNLKKISEYEKMNLNNPLCSCIAKKPDIKYNDEVVSLNESVVDVECEKEFKCLLDLGEMDEMLVDLDSPGLSMTQIDPEYAELRRNMPGAGEGDLTDEDYGDEEASCREELPEEEEPHEEEVIPEAESECSAESGLGRASHLYHAPCNPDSYPGMYKQPRNITVIGSETGSAKALKCLLANAFECTDRVLVMTPWGNYVAFKTIENYFIYDGCTCDIQRFRFIDLRKGTAGLLCFDELDEVIAHIMKGMLDKCEADPADDSDDCGPFFEPQKPAIDEDEKDFNKLIDEILCEYS